MKVAHINLAGDFYGGERQTVLLITALAQRGIEQTLHCRRRSPMRAHLQNIAGLSFADVANPFSGHLRRQNNADILHAHEARAAHWCAVEHRIRKTPYIITRRIPNTPKHNRWTLTAYKQAANIVVVSQAVMNSLKAYAALDGCIIPDMCAQLNSNEEAVSKLRAQYAGHYVVGCVASLQKRKGHRYLVEAAKHFAAHIPKIKFLFTGEGEERTALEEAAKDLGNVELLGFVSNVGDYLAIMDLFVLPSTEEGLGSSLLDAMSFALPIIATNIDGIPELVENRVNGLLVPPADSDSLIKAIESLYTDKALAQQLAQAGKKKVAAYSPAAIAEQYASLYQSILTQ